MFFLLSASARTTPYAGPPFTLPCPSPGLGGFAVNPSLQIFSKPKGPAHRQPQTWPKDSDRCRLGRLKGGAGSKHPLTTFARSSTWISAAAFPWPHPFFTPRRSPVRLVPDRESDWSSWPKAFLLHAVRAVGRWQFGASEGHPRRRATWALSGVAWAYAQALGRKRGDGQASPERKRGRAGRLPSGQGAPRGWA